MKKITQLLTVALVAATLGLTAVNLFAQDTTTPPPAPGGGGPGQGGGPGGGRNFDPAQFQQQMQQRMNQFIREKLAITNDDEWGVIEVRLSKVTQGRMEVAFAGMSGFRGMMGNRNGGGGGGRFAGMGQTSPEQDALQHALDSNAPKEEVKSALENLRAVRQRKKDELAKAQDQLKEVLTLRQEALLVSLGMLD
jgi:Spy/CpxP family protein refolding chaperone